MKKLCAFLLASIAAVGCLAGCGGRTETDGGTSKTTLYVWNAYGGVGSEWLENAAKRFEKLREEKSYAPGKKGVVIEINDGDLAFEPASMKTDGESLYFSLDTQISTLAMSGSVYNLDSILDDDLADYGEPGVTLNDKLREESKALLTGVGNDTSVYALPHTSLIEQLSYNAALFEREGWWIADAGAENYTHVNYGSARFVKKSSGEKLSTGPDGKYDTYDDGLPVSMEQFMLLCAKITADGGKPFALAGKAPGYAAMLCQGLWTTFAGREKIDAIYSQEGTVEIVVGEGTEPLFPGWGCDEIKKPITETYVINETDGYKVMNMVEKYYATALLKIFQQNNWFSTSYKNGSSNVEEQANFLSGGLKLGSKTREKLAFLVDGVYWNNEVKMSGRYDEVKESFHLDDDDIDVRIMPYPLQMTGSTADVVGGKQSIKVMSGMAFVNNNIKDNSEILGATLDFLKFCYTDDELVKFTETTSITRPVNTVKKVDTSSMNSFGKSVYEIMNPENSELAYGNPTSEMVKTRLSSFIIGAYGSGVFTYKNEKFLVMMERGSSAWDCFEKTMRTSW